MLHLTLWQIELIPWCAAGLYFAATWLRVKPTKLEEESNSRILRYAVMIFAALLIFSTDLRMGLLGKRFVPEALWIQSVGIVLTFAGAALLCWARFALGKFFSADVTLKQGHQLIQSGPYALVRHPIYTGINLAVAGTALEIGEWRGVLAFALVVIMHIIKARQEEALMAAQFGDEYSLYRRHSGFLIPRFR